MKKAIVVAVGLALAGCQSNPQKQSAAPEPVAVKPVQQATAEPQKVTPAPEVKEPAKASPAAVEPASAPVPVPVAPVAAPAAEPEKTVAARPASMEQPKPLSGQARQLDPRMDKIVKLIYSSSGARQVVESGDPMALEHHAKAKALYEQATQATEKQQASQLLNAAVKEMYSAIRAAGRDQVLAEKRKADFDKLKRSVDTFMEQHERISAEKGNGGEGEALRGQVRTLVAKAEEIFPQRPDDAKVMLREGFEMLRNSIESMREGETLVRSLNFANKQEEYDYELEKFKSQRLLVNVLVESKKQSSSYMTRKVSEYIEKAEAFRAEAEAAAARGDHDTGVKKLEEGRKWIVRALRTGGIFVPG